MGWAAGARKAEATGRRRAAAAILAIVEIVLYRGDEMTVSQGRASLGKGEKEESPNGSWANKPEMLFKSRTTPKTRVSYSLI